MDSIPGSLKGQNIQPFQFITPVQILSLPPAHYVDDDITRYTRLFEDEVIDLMIDQYGTVMFD